MIQLTTAASATRAIGGSTTNDLVTKVVAAPIKSHTGMYVIVRCRQRVQLGISTISWRPEHSAYQREDSATHGGVDGRNADDGDHGNRPPGHGDRSTDQRHERENEGSERRCQVTPDDGEGHAGIRDRSFVPLASRELATSQHRPDGSGYVLAHFSDEEGADDPVRTERVRHRLR